MKKIIRPLLLLLGIFILTSPAIAQKKLKKGKVIYKLDLAEMKDNPMASMIGNMNLSFFFDPAYQSLAIDVMGMLNMKVIQPVNVSSTPGTVLLSMFGQKYQVSDLNPAEFLKDKTGASANNQLEVTYDKKDKKKILGYKCCKAEVSPPDGSTITFYISDKIKSTFMSGLTSFPKLKGFPLEIIITAPNGSVNRLTASEISGNLSDDAFKVGSGYQKMTMKELEKELGGLLN